MNIYACVIFLCIIQVYLFIFHLMAHTSPRPLLGPQGTIGKVRIFVRLLLLLAFEKRS